jgi:hypothetical protein
MPDRTVPAIVVAYGNTTYTREVTTVPGEGNFDEQAVTSRDDDARANEALTDLSAYALSLEAERHRMDGRLLELAGQDSSVTELQVLLRERAEIAAEVSAFREIIAVLRDQISYRAASHAEADNRSSRQIQGFVRPRFEA